MEFNLSKKREGPELGYWSYPEEDVKECFRLLKEEGDKALSSQALLWFNVTVDKLIGDELNGKRN